MRETDGVINEKLCCEYIYCTQVTQVGLPMGNFSVVGRVSNYKISSYVENINCTAGKPISK